MKANSPGKRRWWCGLLLAGCLLGVRANEGWPRLPTDAQIAEAKAKLVQELNVVRPSLAEALQPARAMTGIEQQVELSRVLINRYRFGDELLRGSVIECDTIKLHRLKVADPAKASEVMATLTFAGLWEKEGGATYEKTEYRLYMLKYNEHPMYQPLKLWHFSSDGYEFGRVVQRDPGAKAQRDAVLQSYYDLGKLVNGFSPGAVAESVDLQLTFPNGASPKVFTTGWTFGAKAILNPGTKGEKDVSAQVRWTGSGVFSPVVGAVSHPVFAREGANAIELTVTVNKQKYSAKFTVEAVRPNHATIGGRVACPADTHGCQACPHAVVGQIATGNPKVRINGRPVACVGDTGQHAPCCGPNTFKIVSGDPQVLVDGKPVARVGDQTEHCGGIGQVTSAFGSEAPKAGEPGRK